MKKELDEVSNNIICIYTVGIKTWKEMMNDIETRILDAAIRLFTARGLRRTTVEEIAREANLGKGTIYNYFSRKTEILAAVVKRQSAFFSQEYLKIIDRTDRADEALTKFFTARHRLLRNFVKHYEIKEEIYNEIMSEQIGVLKKAGVHARRELLEILKGGMERGELQNYDPEIICNILFTIFSSFDVHWLFHESETLTDQNIRSLIQIVIYGLVGKQPA